MSDRLSIDFDRKKNKLNFFLDFILKNGTAKYFIENLRIPTFRFEAFKSSR